ncbi:tetratricopeptide repeat-containing sensor histidine kinase [Gelidibacter salicanalis]|uniref:Tetratricopeptide repeat protein n=1 Tax=Gelidibacter salicanalis TaxID=291193 RepID=A0A934KX14_9FLAO|nr:tetratricopeptide repeat protein [Gelidibacter salicanalis]MBJ7880885.1 tetratricopeptide repeat protein [Gelidibacter salicanalis]
MQFISLKQIASTQWPYRAGVLALLFFCTMAPLSAQNETTKDDESALRNLQNSWPKTYETIDSLLSRFDNDSLVLKDLILKSKAANALEVESYALNKLGEIYRNISAYDAALELHLKAEKRAQQAHNIQLEVISLNMIGVVYRRMDLIKPALDYHKKALDIANSVEHQTQELQSSIAVSQNSMGNIYLTLKQYDLAIEQFEKSLVIEKKSGNRLGLAINYHNLGYADEAKGFLDLALENYQRSLNYNEQINSEVGRVICYTSIGQVYIKQKKYNDAKIIIEKGLKKALLLGDQFYISYAYINLGWVQNELQMYKAAEENLKKGLEISETYGLKTSTVDAHKRLSELYKKQNAYKTALYHYEEAVELEKTIFTERNMQYVSDIIIQYENEAKNDQILKLANENELVKSRMQRNQSIFWFAILTLAIIAVSMIVINRNRQLRHEKQILTLEQDMLRSQMNPHFIFNSLNSIKLYIINNEKENAVYYLNKFSKFIRKILIASTEKEISLEDELDTMQLYMNIENIRFSNEIHFTIDVASGINTSNIRVPSLILQPFLENALWHGLSSKKEDKQIKMKVYKDNAEFVTISITDNGIGRKASEQINHNRVLKRKSVGLAMTKARLTNFSKRFTTVYNMEIEDLYDNQNQPTGTRIVVNIPIRTNNLKSA